MASMGCSWSNHTGRPMSGYNAAMKRRRPIRRILKWAGLAVCIFVFAAWVVSGRFRIEHIVRYSDVSFDIAISRGNLLVAWGPFARPSWFRNVTDFEEWHPHMGSSPRLDRYGKKGTHVVAPLWLLFLIVAVLTAALFYRDHRRIPPGHCQKCGYDLTGNMSGKCPECGAGVLIGER